MNAVALLASERSGTNLLRAILSSHSRIASPPPTGIIYDLAPIHSVYFPLRGPSRLRELVEDAIVLTQTHMNPWNVSLDADTVIQRLGSETYWEVFRVMNELYAEEFSATCWLTKEPGLFNYIYQIKRNVEEIKFIYLVRDGRDVVSSMLEGGRHDFHVYHAAQKWAREQRSCLNAYIDRTLQEEILLCRYEDLVRKPEDVIRQIMTFLDLKYESDQLAYHKERTVLAHAEKSRFWRNLSKPIDASNINKFKTRCSTSQIRIIESCTWAEMKSLGYTPENRQRGRVTWLERLLFFIVRELRKGLSEITEHRRDPRWRARKTAVRRILQRDFDR